MSNQPTIQAVMAKVMTAVRGVGKNDRNNQQNFAFRGIDAVLNAVGPVLREHGVFPTPTLVEHHSETVEVGQKRTLMKSVFVVVTYTFHGPGGDSVSATVPGEAMDSGDKAFSKAMSVAFRTALIQTLALPTDEPKDPDHDTYERSPQREQPTRFQGQRERPAAVSGPGVEVLTKRAAGAVTALLDADSEARAQEVAENVANRSAGDLDATPHVPTDDRDVLGLAHDERLSVDDLVAYVGSYWARHGCGPRAQRGDAVA